ncbi:hypothetical protein COHA_007313, partial [Chlorella ohadii]
MAPALLQSGRWLLMQRLCSRGGRQSLRSAVVAAYEQQRGAGSRARGGGGGGGRWGGDRQRGGRKEEDSTSIWGNDWDIDTPAESAGRSSGSWGQSEERSGSSWGQNEERSDRRSGQERSGGNWRDREERTGGNWRGGQERGGWRGREERSGGSWGDNKERSGGSWRGGGLRQFWVGDVLYGVSPVLAALQAGRREVHTLYLQDGMDLSKRKDKGAIQAAKKRAEELGARVEYASKHDLNMVADNRPHQGVVLDCSPLEFEPLPSLPDAPEGPAAGGRLPVWLCLDEVMDPQNFGAALRSAYFLGVDGVLTCHRNSAPLSAAVSKASAGAMELVPVHSCKSLPQTLADAKERGWQVLGAAAEPGAQPAAAFVLQRPAILVMGNEGYGLRGAVRRLCDATLQIEDSPGRHTLVDSLNV